MENQTKSFDDFMQGPEDAVAYAAAAEAAINSARTALVLGNKPSTVFFAQLALKLEPTVAWSIPTAATDGERLYFNPKFILSLTPKRVVGLLAHETLHPAFGHHARRAGRDPRQWNIAADMAINPIVKECGLELPDGCLWPSQINAAEGESAEFYYARLDEEDEPDQGDGEPDGEQGDGEPDGEQGEDSGESPGGAEGSEDDASGAGDGSPPSDPTSEGGSESGSEGSEDDSSGKGGGAGQEAGQRDFSSVADPGGCGAVMDADGDKAAQQQAEERWKVDMVKAAATAKQIGDLPSSVNKLIDDVVEGTIDWRQPLAEFVQSRAKTDYSWSPPNRRFIAAGQYLPSLSGDAIGKGILLIDQSGSVSDYNIAQVAGEVESIGQTFDIELSILYHDTEVQNNGETWSPMDGPLRIKREKCGGTSHVQPLAYIDDTFDDGEHEFILAFTDGHTRYPDTPPVLPVLWVIFNNPDAGPPFGSVIHIADGE